MSLKGKMVAMSLKGKMVAVSPSFYTTIDLLLISAIRRSPWPLDQFLIPFWPHAVTNPSTDNMYWHTCTYVTTSAWSTSWLINTVGCRIWKPKWTYIVACWMLLSNQLWIWRTQSIEWLEVTDIMGVAEGKIQLPQHVPFSLMILHILEM